MVQQTPQSRLPEIDFDNLVFGHVFTDHMFVADFNGEEWTDMRIVPYGPLTMQPAAAVLHYGQAIFEGMKAFKNTEGEIFVFRPTANFNRLNKSAVRMCMPELPKEIFMSGLKQLLTLDKGWIPTSSGSSLYVRPFMIATDSYLGVKASSTYKFMIICSPVTTYYKEPVRVKIELEYVRAAVGGVGFAKAAGNYASALYPAALGREKGFHQMVWTDAKEHKYIEESGTMNVMFMINNTLITPKLSTSILDGVTRNSVLKLARDWGYTVEERAVTVDEVVAAAKDGTLSEAFGTGTAANIARIAAIGYKDEVFDLNLTIDNSLAEKVDHYLGELKSGKITDAHKWILKF